MSSFQSSACRSARQNLPHLGQAPGSKPSREILKGYSSVLAVRREEGREATPIHHVVLRSVPAGGTQGLG